MEGSLQQLHKFNAFVLYLSRSSDVAPDTCNLYTMYRWPCSSELRSWTSGYCWRNICSVGIDVGVTVVFLLAPRVVPPPPPVAAAARLMPPCIGCPAEWNAIRPTRKSVMVNVNNTAHGVDPSFSYVVFVVPVSAVVLFILLLFSLCLFRFIVSLLQTIYGMINNQPNSNNNQIATQQKIANPTNLETSKHTS